jgi:hypothetical protein
MLPPLPKAFDRVMAPTVPMPASDRFKPVAIRKKGWQPGPMVTTRMEPDLVTDPSLLGDSEETGWTVLYHQGTIVS